MPPFDKNIPLKKFCNLLNFPADRLPDGFLEKFNAINTNYRTMGKEDIEKYLMVVLDLINSPYIKRNRVENLKAWEHGWNENLESFKIDFSEEHLKPKYFRPCNFFRFDKTVVVPENTNIEYELFLAVRHLVFHKYFREFDSIYELGCGSCQNIFALAKLFPEKEIFGLDWTNSSKQIADILSKKLYMNIKGLHFDFMKPPKDLAIGPNSLIYSIHSLEQLGAKHESLLRFLLKQKPKLVVNYEPLVELYQQDNLYDSLAVMYSKNRNYLSNYLTELRKLAQLGKIEILEELRPFIGGIYHEASLIVWRPV